MVKLVELVIIITKLRLFYPKGGALRASEDVPAAVGAVVRWTGRSEPCAELGRDRGESEEVLHLLRDQQVGAVVLVCSVVACSSVAACK